MLGVLEPENGPENQLAAAMRMLACFPSILTYWHRYAQDGDRD